MDQNGMKLDENEKLEQTNQKLQELEKSLNLSRKELNTYQNMLEQSQNQYADLEKKYNKAKHLVREFHQRELDMLHREDFYQQLLQEKDTEYNALVKNLKDRIIALEQSLLETQRKAGLPMALPYDSISLKQLTPQMTRRQPPKLFFQRLDPDFSDTEVSDASPEDGKTATVERKLPIKEEFDRAVPPHELLDISANKSKAELANRGALANRQLPSGKKGSLSNSSSDYGLDESYNSGDDLTDSTFSPNDSVRRKADSTTTSIKQPTLGARNYIQQYEQQQQQQYSTQTIHYSVQNVQYTAVQKPNQHHVSDHNNSVVYARVQKDNSTIHQNSPDPWAISNKGVNIGLGPPPSLAEQLKQVNFILK